MKTILEILKAEFAKHGPATLTSPLHVRIENPGFMPLVIEINGERGPDGHLVVSVAHVYLQNGDVMYDPEMEFQLAPAAEGTTGFAWGLYPFTYRQDGLGLYQLARFIEDGQVKFRPKLRQEQLKSFCRGWDQNLRDQGFLAAYERQVAA